MNRIIDTLFLKRFCLPFDTDMSAFESSIISKCLCGNYNHASCIFKGR